MERAAATELLGRLHAAQGAFYAGGPHGPLRDVLAGDVEWHVPGRNAIAGDYHGIDAVLAYLRAGATSRLGRSGCSPATSSSATATGSRS